MNLARGKFLAVALGAVVGRQIDDGATARQRLRQRFGRKQVTAGAAGRQQDERRAALKHHAGLAIGTGSPGLASNCARGRSRVNASSMPMP